MKVKNISTKLGMAALTAAMVAAPAINVFAAPEDIIDTNKKATLTIHKYDMTAATEDGIDLSQFKANGKRDTTAESVLSDYVIGGVEFTYVRVGDIKTDSDGGKIQVLYEIPTNLQPILGLTGGKGDMFPSDQINDKIAELLKGDNNTVGKNALEAYIQTGAGKQAMEMTSGEDGIARADNLPLGLYLVVETKVPANVHTTTDPFFVSLPMTDLEGSAWFYDVDVYPKNQTNIPDLDKLVRQNDDAVLYGRPEYGDTATVSEGDKVDYILVSHLPKITSTSSYLTKYEFVDSSVRGSRFNKDTKIYFFNTEAEAKECDPAKAIEVWDTKSPYFEDKYAGGEGGIGTLQVSMTKEGLERINGLDTAVSPTHARMSEKYMVVYYSTVVNSSDNAILGDKGMTNDVVLTWRRTNMDDEDRLEDRARIFTYGLNLTKYFQKDGHTGTGAGKDAVVSGEDMSKVTFVLQNKTDGHYITATSKPSSGVYYVTDSKKGTAEPDVNGGSPAEGTIVGQDFHPAPDGKLIIYGLEADDYVLTELQTADGFNLLKEPINISIKCTQDEFIPSQTTLYDKKDKANNKHKKMIETPKDRASATVDGKATAMLTYEKTVNNDTISSDNAEVQMTVTNTPGFKLPATGGAGTIAFTVAGCSVAFVGIAMATKKSKKDDDK